MRRLPHRRVIHVQIAADGAHHHLAAVQADADLHRHTLGALHLGGILLHRRLHGEGGVAGPYGVVFMGNGGAEQRHDAIAHDLVDGALVAVHRGHHAVEHRVQELARLLGVAVGQQGHGAFEVGKQHGDVLALAFEGGAGGEDFLRQIGRGVGQRGTLLGGGGRCGGRGRGASITRPDEDVALLIHREALGVDEFGFEILEVGVIEAKLPLQSPIRHALTLAEEDNHLIEDRVKVHPAPSCPCRGDYGSTTASPHTRGDVLYVSHIAGKGKQEVRERVTHGHTATAQTLHRAQAYSMTPSPRDANKHAKARQRQRLHARERLECDRLQTQMDCALLADLEARAGDRSLSGAKRGGVLRSPGLTPHGVIGVVLHLTRDLQRTDDDGRNHLQSEALLALCGF